MTKRNSIRKIAASAIMACIFTSPVAVLANEANYLSINTGKTVHFTPVSTTCKSIENMTSQVADVMLNAGFVPEIKEEEKEEAAVEVKAENTVEVKEEAKAVEAAAQVEYKEVKNEAAPAAIETVNTVEVQPVVEVQAAPVVEDTAPVYMHSVNANAGAEFRHAYTADFLNAIRSGSRFLYFAGSEAEADLSLGEIVYDYCAMNNGGGYYMMEDAQGKYMELDPAEFNSLQNAVFAADSQWNAYAAQVAAACNSLNLNTTDRDLVNQINAYICNNFNYQIINITSMPYFMNNRTGQCYHYAKLFADMCNAVGISAWKVENVEHAWNQVVVDGTTYTFDTTYNDTCGNMTAYSWQ